MIASTSRPNWPMPLPCAAVPLRIAENSGPDAAKAMTPASRVRTIPNRRPSNRRATAASRAQSPR